MEEFKYPNIKALNNCCKIACNEDKPIMMDYWNDSINGTALIGVKDNEEKILVKNTEEYTSPISKIYKVDEEFIIITENSIYLVSSKITTRKIN